jgi:hypothetical protein
VTVADTLAAAGISPTRCGSERTSGLSDAELGLYQWVLRRFAEHGKPSGHELRVKATELGLERERTLEALAREDLLHTNTEGEIVVAYPFSGRPTRHHVLLESGQEVDAMCAIDAVGVAAMLGMRVRVRSSDPTTEDEITVSVDPSGHASWQPLEAVVVAGAGATARATRAAALCSTSSARRQAPSATWRAIRRYAAGPSQSPKRSLLVVRSSGRRSSPEKDVFSGPRSKVVQPASGACCIRRARLTSCGSP